MDPLDALSGYLACAGLAGTAEGLLAAMRFGASPATMLDVVSASSGVSFAVRRTIPEQVLTRRFQSGTSIGTAVARLAQAEALADKAGLAAPMLKTAHVMWREAMTRTGPAADMTHAVRAMEEKAGETITATAVSSVAFTNAGAGAAGARVGFVGLGVMGSGMAASLVRAGARVSVYDADRTRAEAFAQKHGATAANSLRDIGQASDVVFTMLPDGAAVRRVLLGDSKGGDRVLSDFPKGGLLIDCTSAEPKGTRDLGEALTKLGFALVDAPVSGGGGDEAAEGLLTLMVGGDGAAVQRAAPLLAAMGKKIVHTGGLATGHAIKACNNTFASLGMAAATEALLIGRRLGLAADRMLEHFNATPAANRATEHTMKNQVLTRRFHSGFFLGYQVNNIRGAVELARASRIDAPLFRQCLQLWEAALQTLGPRADYTEIIRHWETDAGATIA